MNHLDRIVALAGGPQATDTTNAGSGTNVVDIDLVIQALSAASDEELTKLGRAVADELESRGTSDKE